MQLEELLGQNAAQCCFMAVNLQLLLESLDLEAFVLR